MEQHVPHSQWQTRGRHIGKWSPPRHCSKLTCTAIRPSQHNLMNLCKTCAALQRHQSTKCIKPRVKLQDHHSPVYSPALVLQLFIQSWRPLANYAVKAGVVCWQVKLCDPHLSALEVRFSRRGAIKIYVYLYLYLTALFIRIFN